MNWDQVEGIGSNSKVMRNRSGPSSLIATGTCSQERRTNSSAECKSAMAMKGDRPARSRRLGSWTGPRHHNASLAHVIAEVPWLGPSALAPPKHTRRRHSSNLRTIAVRSEIERLIEHSLRLTILRRVSQAAPHHVEPGRTHRRCAAPAVLCRETAPSLSRNNPSRKTSYTHSPTWPSIIRCRTAQVSLAPNARGDR